MADNLDLFGDEPRPKKTAARLSAPRDSKRAPLAEKLRPHSWDDFQGLAALDQNLIRQLRGGQGKPPSMILWGPPGSGKTTFAKLVGRSFDFNFVELSAVLGGVKEVREIVAEAQQSPRQSILFVDEIHRFNKAQQDAFLPHVENGTIILIGATTENPSFYLTGALLSRAKVIVMPSHDGAALENILARATREVGSQFDDEAARILITFAAGDARRLINLIEAFAASNQDSKKNVSGSDIKKFISDSRSLFYDRSGEEHYNVVSAMIKSLRGSDPDAALYWAFRMIEGGEDPRYVIRRLMIFASEDIGNADPRALQVAVATSEAYEKLGLPEGRIPLAQCVTYLATAPKSNRSYAAMNSVVAAIKQSPKVDVPMHLRNAPTKLMKDLKYGEGYEYPHNFDQGYAAEVEYLPKELVGQQFYEPTDRGYEKNISERMQMLRQVKRAKA